MIEFSNCYSLQFRLLTLHRHAWPGALEYHKHLGQGRKDQLARLRDRPIVFTTYATVASEFCRGITALADINWFRIILDEGEYHTQHIEPLLTQLSSYE
jgi:hypothetical protein